jgi:hypothetical protein
LDGCRHVVLAELNIFQHDRVEARIFELHKWLVFPKKKVKGTTFVTGWTFAVLSKVTATSVSLELRR